MGKHEVVKAMSKKSGVTQKDCKKALEAFIDLVISSDTEKEIKIRGLGMFYWRETKEREGTHPQNPNVIIAMPARKYLMFKASKTLSKDL